MSELYVNVSGTWKTASNYYVNVNGTWKEGSEIHAKVSSAWKQSGSTASLITTNLVLHLDASNSSSYSGSGTTWSDLSGDGNDLTLTNGPTFTSDNGGAIVFDGTNDYAASPLNQSFFQFGTGDYTLGIWVKFDSVSNFEGFLSCGPGNTSGAWQFGHSGTKFRYRLGTGGTNIDCTATQTRNLDQWYYIVVVNDRSENECKLYVDGSIDKTSGTNSTWGSSNVGVFTATDVKNCFNVGRNRNQNLFLDGAVAQVHVYKGKALTASEVLTNYNATKANYHD